MKITNTEQIKMDTGEAILLACRRELFSINKQCLIGCQVRITMHVLQCFCRGISVNWMGQSSPCSSRLSTYVLCSLVGSQSWGPFYTRRLDS